MAELNRCREIFNTICETHKGNDCMINKISKYLLSELSPRLRANSFDNDSNSARESWFRRHAARVMDSVITEQQYFFIKQSHQYVKYNDDDYHPTTFDAILIDVRDRISRDIGTSQNAPTTGLTEWKQEVGCEVLEKIQTVFLHETIPNSSTIQTVISSLFPSIFETRDEAKYFLTVIGDSLMGKFDNMVYLTDISLKPYITKLQRDIGLIMGIPNCLTGFKYKYHDHTYGDCRILNVCIREDIVYPQNPLNLFAVALHYSMRHSGADEFAERYLRKETLERLFLLRDNSASDIIHTFIDTMIQRVDSSIETNVQQKDILFLWKNFLESKKLPNIMFSTTFIDIFRSIENISYIFVESDCVFTNITSNHLPGVSSFRAFWDKCIVLTNNPMDELELDEITLLYRSFLTSSKRSLTLDASDIHQIIRHFHPSIDITGEKFVYGITHKHWDKFQQVCDFLNKTNSISIDTMSITSMYKKYTECDNGTYIVSKNYFESVVNKITTDVD